MPGCGCKQEWVQTGQMHLFKLDDASDAIGVHAITSRRHISCLVSNASEHLACFWPLLHLENPWSSGSCPFIILMVSDPAFTCFYMSAASAAAPCLEFHGLEGVLPSYPHWGQ